MSVLLLSLKKWSVAAIPKPDVTLVAALIAVLAMMVLPMPTVLILAPDLTVRWVDVHPDYTTRSEPAEILAALDAITT